MKKRLRGWWKKLIPALLLTISVVLLLQDVSSNSGWRRSQHIDADNKKWNLYLYTTAKIQGKEFHGDVVYETEKGLRCYWNELIYRHNSCGYYQSRWAYWDGGAPSSLGMYFARVLLGIVFFALFFVPLLLWNFWIPAALLPLLAFLGVLLLAVSPGYWSVVFLITGLLALRLVRKNPWEKGMPRLLTWLYLALFVVLFALPWLMPERILPSQPDAWKTSVTEVLRQIKLLEDETADSDQTSPAEKPTEARPEQEEDVPKDPEMRESDAAETSEAGQEQSDLDASAEKKSPANGGWSESGGRTDQTGMLQFQNVPIATVSSIVMPYGTEYLRLYAAEEWRENRWFVNGDGAEWRQDPATYRWKDSRGEREIPGYPRTTIERRQYEDECLEVPESLREYFRKEFPELPEETGEERLTGIALEAAVSRTRELLAERAYYTFNPGSPDPEMDFVEWFLKEAGKGYCMHFASAGVMLLRYQGVPTRYAEGYAIPANQWSQAEEGRWEAQAMDYEGHAWAECYDYKLGSWTVAEMTPAYDTGAELREIGKVESDRIVRRWRVVGVLVAGILGIGSLAAAGFVGADRLRARREYRRMHSGSTRRDICYMLTQTVKRMERVSKKERKKGRHLRQLDFDPEKKSEFLEQSLQFLEGFGCSQTVCDSFVQLTEAGYRAAFARRPEKEERDAAEKCYFEVKHALTPPIEIRIWRRSYRFRL